MICPKCEAPARVLETRWSPKEQCTRRRLGCPSCGFRFTILGGVMLKDIDQKLDADGLPRYTETIQILESLVISAGKCKEIDQHQVFKAWAIIDRFKTHQAATNDH
jgi:transcriptional regulator NrdR family protein